MRIGINAYCLEGERKGEGRYLSNILKQWLLHYKEDEFILYLKHELQRDPFLQSGNVQQILIGSPMQVFLPWRASRDDVDVLFSPSYVLPFILPSCKTAVVIHDISYEVLPDLLPWKEKVRLKLLSRHSAIQSDIVLTVSQFSKREIHKYYKIPKNKILVTYEACDAHFHPVRNKPLLADFKQRYNLGNDFILFVGTIFKRRNVDSLIKAFKIALRRIPKVQLVLIGKIIPSEVDEILKLIHDKSALAQIIHHDFVEENDLNLFYNTAGVMVYPSTYEGFGLPPLEAMCCGTPVIVGPFASLPEVVGNAGVFVNPKEPGDIAEKICNILLNPIWRNELCNRGLNQAARFSWERCAKETYEALERTVNLR